MPAHVSAPGDSAPGDAGPDAPPVDGTTTGPETAPEGGAGGGDPDTGPDGDPDTARVGAAGGDERLPRRGWLVTLGALFVVDRLALWAAGMGFDAAALHPRVPAAAQWQLLDPRLLVHHLVPSLWDLASQPPLYNLAVAVLLRLPAGAQVPVAALAWSALGLVVVLTAYALLVALDVPNPVAVGATVVLLIANPDTAMYERWLFYVEPTAAALTVCAYAALRFLRTRRRRWGVAFFGAAALVVLMNSTYEWDWLLLVAVPVVVVLRRHWRAVAVTAAVPVLAVAGWVAKDVALFGTVTTSSWVGMNLATSTVQVQPPAVLRALVRRGVLSPLAEVPPFSPVSAYAPRFAAAPPAGDGALDERVESNGETNLDNRVYLAVSRDYLTQDLRFIRAEPARYADDVARAMAVWTVAPDDYPWVAQLRAPVAGYARAYDTVVGWQPTGDPKAGLQAEFDHRGPSAAQVSWLAVLVTVLTVGATPMVAWRRRRRDPAAAGALAVIWVTCAFSFVVTSLFEVGENNRFAMELGPLPVVAGVVVGCVAVRALAARRARAGAGTRAAGRGRPGRALPFPGWS